MALLPDVFVPDEAEDDPFAPIPAVWYEADIIKSELKTTKDKKGKYISLHFKIAEGAHKGRLVFTNLNIVNASDVAVKIARSDLKKICGACGITGELEDTVDLHNITIGIKLSIKPESSQWPAKNEIKNFCAVEDIPTDDENPLED